MAPIQRFRGPVLPDGEVRDLYVVDGRITLEPQAGAETVAEGWIVPGLVDAHCHIGLDDHGPISDEESEAQAVQDRDAGALLIRDAGSAADTRWIHDRDDLPRLIRCGRHLARTKRYIRNYADEIEPGELADAAAREARAGDGWIKLVGDWISREEGDLAPSFPAEAFAAAIAAAHENGARVTAHCFGSEVLPWLIEAGIDCIEHGTGLDQGLVDAMVARGTALVPTVMQLDKFPEYAEAGAARFPAYAATMTDLYARRRADDHGRATTPASLCTPAPTAAGSPATATCRGRCSRWPSSACRRSTRSVPRPGGPASGWAGTPSSTRAPRPTWWSTTVTPVTTSPSCTRRRGWCCEVPSLPRVVSRDRSR